MQRLEYLGHIVRLSGIIINLEKTKDIDKCQPPTKIKELQIFFSICMKGSV